MLKKAIDFWYPSKVTLWANELETTLGEGAHAENILRTSILNQGDQVSQVSLSIIWIKIMEGS